MDKELVVFGVVVAALAAAVAFVLWLQEPSPLARVEVEALGERQTRPMAPPVAKTPARSAERQDRYRGP
jgi:hypothetical protein